MKIPNKILFIVTVFSLLLIPCPVMLSQDLFRAIKSVGEAFHEGAEAFKKKISDVAAPSNDPAWYNAEQFPLSKMDPISSSADMARLALSYPPYTMAMITSPIVIRHDGVINSAQFSANNRYVATAYGDGVIKIYDVQARKDHGTIQYADRGGKAHFSPDGSYIVTTAYDSKANVYKGMIHDVQTLQKIGIVRPNDFTRTIIFSSDSRYIVTIFDSRVEIYDTKTQQGNIFKHDGRMLPVSISPNNAYVLASSIENNLVKIYDIYTQNAIGLIKHDSTVTSAVFSPDSKYVATASADGSAKIYDIPSQKIIAVIMHGEGMEPGTLKAQLSRYVHSAQFSPDGRYMVTAAGDGAKVYDMLQQKIIAFIKQPEKHGIPTSIFSTVFSPNGNIVAAVSRDVTEIYDIQEQRKIGSFQDSKIHSAAFSPDGKYLAINSGGQIIVHGKHIGGTIKIYDVQTQQKLGTIQHDSEIKSVNFSPDGKYILTSSYDDTARITPLGFDHVDLSSEQMLAIATLMRLVLAKRANQALQLTLNKNGWVYKTFIQLPDETKNRLLDQFPEVGDLIR